MALVALSASVFNPTAHMILSVSENSVYGAISRRLARTKTLDGGAAIEDLGFNHGDTDWRLEVLGLSKSEVETLRSMFEDQSMIIISSKYGAFTAAPQELTEEPGSVSMTIVINEKVS